VCRTMGVIFKVVLLQVDPQGKQWNRLRSSIGQPQFYKDPAAS